MRINDPYEEVYPIGDDFILVRYEENKTLVHLALANRTYEIKGVKILGSIEGRVVGIKKNELLILKLGE
ncbi:hypothetical protein [Thermococcus stetteri]|uniref:hypothetical protein n=1 Tax=Thermococcus stetteri TaxID=49900 RepID=UPI001AE3B119|nr:hypothetical protein [Thermococcus stetteri]MBP1912969.1 hypothetical protein [Thermococcus stetteri]